MIEIDLPESTYAYPKLGMSRPSNEQEPMLSEGVSGEIEKMLFSRAKVKAVEDEKVRISHT